MEAISFDTLNYSRILQGAEIPQSQADAFTDAQKAALREVLSMQELATKEDIGLLKIDIEQVRGDLRTTELGLKKDIEQVRADLRETELRLQKEIEQVRGEIQQVKYDLLKWQIAGWVALAAIMAKGFGWLGF